MDFDAGWYHSLAVDVNGSCYSFGTDTAGQLGNGDDGSSNVPIRVHDIYNNARGLRHIVKVAAGRSGTHSLAVDSNGYVYGFGYNYYYQCGDETNTDRQYPVRVVDSCDQTVNRYLGDEAFIVDIEAGEFHSLALVKFQNGGYVYEWGNGYNNRTPKKVRNESGNGYLRNIKDIATFNFSLAADSNGNVWYWTTGQNPTRIVGENGTGYLGNIKKVAAGNGICAALDNNGNVWQWPTGGTPFKVVDGEMQTQSGLLENITVLDAGYNDWRVAIDIYGRGWSWGSSASSYGGIGSGIDATEPVEMLCADVAPSVYLEKAYEIQGWLGGDCAEPFNDVLENYLVFEIAYGNPITNPSDPNYVGTISDVNIVDYLPPEMDFYSAPGGTYNADNKTVKFIIGNLAPGQQGIKTVTVKVNEYAKPCGKIFNTCRLSGDGYWTYTDVNVPVCSYGGEIIYVDSNAVGHNNGTDWPNAYIRLADAFTQARSSCAEVTAVWVAKGKGSYKPVYDMNETNYQGKSFELVEGVGLFGNFAGNEQSLDERDFSNSANETILEGRIGSESYQAVYNIVKAQDIENGIVDGFTIRNSSGGAGIFLDDSDVSIVNCKLKNNNNYGIQAANYSYTDIHNCQFVGNSSQSINATNGSWPFVSFCTFDGNDTTNQGINTSGYTNCDIENSIIKNHTGDGYNGSYGQLNVTSCKFESNNDDGLELSNIASNITRCAVKNSNSNGIYTNNGSSLNLKNSIVSYSGNRGINLNYNTETNILNSWIHHNGVNHGEGSGIYSTNHTAKKLLIRNCTLYGNYTYGVECGQYGADPNIRNCIIFGNDSNDLYRQNGSFSRVNYSLLQHTHSGTGNITGAPGFMNIDIDADDLHLDVDSQCLDVGDPCGNYAGETDINGEPRVINGRVDLGGDEFYLSPADFDGNGEVSWDDFFVLCQNWLTAIDGMHDLVDNNFIDFADFTAFAKDWRWKAAWPDKRMLLSTNFTGGIPAGWTVVDGHSDNQKWTTNNPWNRSSSYWTSTFCLVDGDYATYYGCYDMNEVLITSAIDCTDALEVTLKFSHNFVQYGNEKCDVDISINGGAWQNILRYTGTSTGGNITQDISELSANQSNVRIRWHFYYNDSYWAGYWGIDNIQVIGNYRLAGGMQMMRMEGGGGGSTLQSSQMAELESSLFGDIPSIEQSCNGLMLSANESEAKRPQRLIAKSQKFYDITPATTISAKQQELESIKNAQTLADVQAKQTLQAESMEMSFATQEVQAEQIVDVNGLLKWLDDMWQNDEEFRNSMTEQEYLEFRQSIE